MTLLKYVLTFFFCFFKIARRTIRLCGYLNVFVFSVKLWHPHKLTWGCLYQGLVKPLYYLSLRLGIYWHTLLFFRH